MPQGWAMRQPRKNIHFSDKQKGYLDEKFAMGVKNKQEKVNAKALATQMENQLEPDSTTRHLFDPDELLSAKQIASYFSTKARRTREQQPACFDIPDTEECRAIDGQQMTSEGDETEGAKDPMFYNVQDEILEITEIQDLIQPMKPVVTIDDWHGEFKETKTVIHDVNMK
jgi:hypothetical protein